MILVIEGKGTKLFRSGECFRAKGGDGIKEIAAAAVSKILVTSAVSITTDALLLAASEGIPVFFLDDHGHPYGIFDAFEKAGQAYVRRKQTTLAHTPDGVAICRHFLCGKLEGRIRLLKKLKAKRSGDKAAEIVRVIESIRVFAESIKSVEVDSVAMVRNTLQGLEGSAGREYFSLLSALLPKSEAFDGRSFRPVKDRFNAMLNYAYGILYSQVERAARLAGVDPYIGIMHADAYNKPTFVFDAVELFRHYAEETAFKLFSARKVSASMFDTRDGGVFLNGEGRKLLIAAYFRKMSEMTCYKRRRVRIETEIGLRLAEIAGTIAES